MTSSGTRVAFDVGPLHGPRTGVGTATEGMLSALHALPDPPTVLPYLVSFRARPGDGVQRLPLPAALAMRAWSRADRPRADRWLRGAQVIHGTNYTVPPSRIPRLVSVYDCWFLRHPDQVHPDVARASRVLRRAVTTGAVVHASSQATGRAVQELLGPVRVEVVPLGAPGPPPPPPPSAGSPLPELNGSPFVLALGTVERRKNLPRLVEAFGQVAAVVDDVCLVVAGGASDDQLALDEAIGRLPTSLLSRVLLTGRVDEPTKAWLLHHASVLAYPSLDEGFGFPLLEAMSVGLPVVAADVGSIPEVAGNAALLVDPRDVTGLAEALTTAMLDDDRRRQMIGSGHARVAAHDWADTARSLTALYDSLAMEGGHR
jgi:glycosyltransferase involved in cell wall biosynthesis